MCLCQKNSVIQKYIHTRKKLKKALVAIFSFHMGDRANVSRPATRGMWYISFLSCALLPKSFLRKGGGDCIDMKRLLRRLFHKWLISYR